VGYGWINTGGRGWINMGGRGWINTGGLGWIDTGGIRRREVEGEVVVGVVRVVGVAEVVVEAAAVGR
jgi:hypothetical protein